MKEPKHIAVMVFNYNYMITAVFVRLFS